MRSVRKAETYLIRQASEDDLVSVMNINLSLIHISEPTRPY